MAELTLTALTTLLRECAGEDEGAVLSGDILDVEFEDLGYDSIALLETASRIQINYGVALADDVVVEARTPRQLLGLVNRAVDESA